MRIRQRFWQFGTVAPAKRGRPARSGRLERFGTFVKARIGQTPDMIMPELAEALWQAHGMRAAQAELSRFVRHWGVCGCPLFGKHNLRSVGGVFDRTCVRPLSVANHDAMGRYAVRKAGFTSVQRAASARAPGLNLPP